MNTYNHFFTKTKSKKERRIKRTSVVIPVDYALYAVNDTNKKNVPELLLKDLERAYKDYLGFTRFDAIYTSPQVIKDKRAAFDKFYLLNKEIYSLLDKKE